MNEASPLSAQHFEMFIKQVANHFSELRRIGNLLWEHRRRLASIRDAWSSDEEMALDWRNACDFMALKILEGREIQLVHLEPTSYPILEDSWLQRIKQIKAYYIWESCDSKSSDENYFEASNEIRRDLLERERAPLGEFGPIRAYIRKSYLKAGSVDKLDDHKAETQRMIKRKAYHIYELTREANPRVNWHRARLYATLFYENIIGAVEDDSDRLEKTIKVLRAFQFSKSPRNKYWVVNAFESAVAINFLDRDTIQKILAKPAQYDFSMEPVPDWPAVEYATPNISYDQDHKQLIYLGHMTDAERAGVLRDLHQDRHRRAVENLFQQCQLGPFKDTIL